MSGHRASVRAQAARRLLLDGQGLCADPVRRASSAVVDRVVRGMGYVQIDTINVIERAHHHILMSRLDGYRHIHLGRLLERDRRLFEHWTHDASIIPVGWLRPWRVRFARYSRSGHSPNSWWRQRMGPQAQRVIDHVMERIEREGPARSRDFEHDGERRGGGWWGWKPQKTALEFLWRSGRLAVTARDGFEKVYDLMERVYPDAITGTPPEGAEHVAWACREALDRLGAATAGELAAFFGAVTAAEARGWCAEASARGEVEPVLIESEDGSRPRPGVAVLDWARRARRERGPDRITLLNPFDPVVRDRARCLRLFGFDYRFEAFVPAAKRRYGYYVLPILEGESLVGRLDAKHDRDRGTLVVNGVWWEAGVKPTPHRRRLLREALERLAEQIGATNVNAGRRMPTAGS